MDQIAGCSGAQEDGSHCSGFQKSASAVQSRAVVSHVNTDG